MLTTWLPSHKCDKMSQKNSEKVRKQKKPKRLKHQKKILVICRRIVTQIMQYDCQLYLYRTFALGSKFSSEQMFQTAKVPWSKHSTTE